MQVFSEPGLLISSNSYAELIPAMMDKLDNLKEEMSLAVENGKEMEVIQEVSRIDRNLGLIEQTRSQMGEKQYYGSFDAIQDCHFLIDELNLFSPDNHYFGKHPEDQLSYGWWPINS